MVTPSRQRTRPLLVVALVLAASGLVAAATVDDDGHEEPVDVRSAEDEAIDSTTSTSRVRATTSTAPETTVAALVPVEGPRRRSPAPRPRRPRWT